MHHAPCTIPCTMLRVDLLCQWQVFGTERVFRWPLVLVIGCAEAVLLVLYVVTRLVISAVEWLWWSNRWYSKRRHSLSYTWESYLQDAAARDERNGVLWWRHMHAWHIECMVCCGGGKSTKILHITRHHAHAQ